MTVFSKTFVTVLAALAVVSLFGCSESEHAAPSSPAKALRLLVPTPRMGGIRLGRMVPTTDGRIRPGRMGPTVLGRIKVLVAWGTTVVMTRLTVSTPWMVLMAQTMVKPIVRFKALPSLGHRATMTVIAKGERVCLPMPGMCVPVPVVVRDANKRVISFVRPDFFAYHCLRAMGSDVCQHMRRYVVRAFWILIAPRLHPQNV